MIQHIRRDAPEDTSHHSGSLAKAGDKNSSAKSKCNAFSILVLMKLSAGRHFLAILEPITGQFGDIEMGVDGMWV